MPLAVLLKSAKPVADADHLEQLEQPCLLVRVHDTGLWRLLCPETNNVLCDGVDTGFVQGEITAGRLRVEDGWEPLA